MQITEALARFVVQLEADGRSPHTVAQYRRHIAALARWVAAAGLPDDVATLTPDDLARFLVSPQVRTRADGRSKQPTSVNTVRSSLRTFFGYLHGAGVVPQDPSRLIRRALCASPPPRAVHDDDVEKLLAVLSAATGAGAARDRVLVQLLLATGIRLGSALALDVADLDLAHRELHLRCTKGNRPDRVEIDAAIADALRELVSGRTSGPVFLGRGAQRLSARHFQRRLALWSQRAGIRHVSPHRLRHTRATKLYRETRDLLLVKEALRHRSIMSTVRYASRVS